MFKIEKIECKIKKRAVREAISEAIKHFKNKPIVACEIGVFKGSHSIQILEFLNIKKLYLIDPYSKYKEYEKDGAYLELDTAEKKAKNRLKKYNNKLKWIKKYSDDAVNDIEEELDFCYIDGNHFWPYVYNDIKNYYPLIKKNGIIAGHDYNYSCFDVRPAVDVFFENKKIVKVGKADWVVIK